MALPKDQSAPAAADPVDRTLLEAMRALAPVERLRLNDQVIRMIAQLREGVDRLHEREHGGR